MIRHVFLWKLAAHENLREILDVPKEAAEETPTNCRLGTRKDWITL